MKGMNVPVSSFLDHVRAGLFSCSAAVDFCRWLMLAAHVLSKLALVEERDGASDEATSTMFMTCLAPS